MQARDHPLLVGGDGGRVAVVDVEGPDGRAGQLAGEGLGELVHVDRAGAGGREVGAGEAIDGEVVGAARGEQDPAAGMAPGADDRGQAGDRPHGHAAAVVALEAVVEADQRGLLAGVAAGERRDGRDVDPRDRGHALGGVLLQDAAAERAGADGPAGR